MSNPRLQLEVTVTPDATLEIGKARLRTNKDDTTTMVIPAPQDSRELSGLIAALKYPRVLEVWMNQASIDAMQEASNVAQLKKES